MLQKFLGFLASLMVVFVSMQGFAQPANFGPGSESVITHLPEATGVYQGMTFPFYDKQTADGRHTLVYGPTFGIARALPSGEPLVARETGNVVAITCSLWPNESIVQAYQQRTFASRPELKDAPISRLELFDVTAAVFYVEPGDGKGVKASMRELYRELRPGAVNHQGDFVIRCALPEGAFDELGKVRNGAVEVRWTYYYRVRDRVVTNWLRIVSNSVLVDEIKKDLKLPDNWESVPAKRVAVFANQRGAFSGIFARNIGVYFSTSLTPAQFDDYFKRVEGLLVQQQTIEMTLGQLMQSQAAIYYQGLEPDGRNSADVLTEKLDRETIDQSARHYDESITDVLREMDQQNFDKTDFAERMYKKDTGNAAGGGNFSFGKLSLGGSGSKAWDKLSDEEKKLLTERYAALYQSFKDNSSTRSYLENSFYREADGQIGREVRENKLYQVTVYDLTSLARQVQASVGEEAFSDRSTQQTVVATIGNSGLSDSRLSPLDQFYAPPGTIIEYRGNPADIDSSVLWLRCDGREIPANSPLHALGIITTPNRVGRVPRGVTPGENVGTLGGSDSSGVLTTSEVKDHTHPIGSHIHTLPDSTGLVATTGSAPASPRAYLSTDNAGRGSRWGSGQHIVVDPGGPSQEGDHRHELGGSTGLGGEGSTSEAGKHQHSISAIDLRPSYEATVWLIRIR